jgi:two-component system capsular synthesis sensor histidine kinase RcsC
MPGEIRDGVRWVRISVSDDGIGISQTRLKRVFEPFIQADRSIASRFGGTGLGLTLCSRIITLMGGHITVDSEEGEGSLFTVNVPLTHDSPTDESPLVRDTYDFSTVVIVCDAPLWQLTLVAQVKHWFPETKVIEAESMKAFAAGNERAIIVFATLGPSLASQWHDVQPTYLDTVILSGDGPPFPERRDKDLWVTSFSASMFKLALAACGKHDEVFEQGATCPQSSVVHRDTRVLIAEDDPLNRTLLEHQLAALGYSHVDSVGDGKEALERCLANTYDIVVTDLGMPVMDGETFIKAIRAKGVATPVIVSTAETGGNIQSKTSGFAEVLHKPITMDRLNAALDQVLGAARSALEKTFVDLPATLVLTEMRGLFLAGWENDERALREALEANDSKRFLGRLHRLKGALLALGEKSVAEACERLRRQVELEGINHAQTAIDALIERLLELVSEYRKAPLLHR